MKVELESQESAILCYSKPAAIEGKIADNYTKLLFFCGKIEAKKNSFWDFLTFILQLKRIKETLTGVLYNIKNESLFIVSKSLPENFST